MKKFVLLYAFTAGLIVSILLGGWAVIRSFVPVTAVKLNARTAKGFVICSGKVEADEATPVCASYAGVVEDVFVQPGDKIEKNQPILQIRYQKASASNYGSLSSASDYSKYLGKSIESEELERLLSSEAESSKTSDGSDDFYVLRAPAAGTLKSLSVAGTGDYVAAGNSVASISRNSGLRVRLTVDESQIADLKKGQQVQVTGVGFSHSTYFGSITSIASEAKQVISASGQQTVVEVLADVDNPGADLLPGFTAKAKITVSQENHALIVPYEAVREDEQGNEFVYISAEGRAAKRIITTGAELDDGFEVKQGLQENESVITDPDDVQDGEKIIPTAGKRDSSE